MTLNIHQDIKDKLDFFIKSDKIPNIIFHGQSGSGKRTLVSKFVSNIYNERGILSSQGNENTVHRVYFSH